MPRPNFEQPFVPVGCAQCRALEKLDFDFTMAFQPIVDVRSGIPYAYEALVRGVQGEGALKILDKVNADNLYRFDQACRVKAIELAASLGLTQIPDCKLSINFFPMPFIAPKRASAPRSRRRASSASP